jgi:hypothetical protein
MYDVLKKISLENISDLPYYKNNPQLVDGLFVKVIFPRKSGHKEELVLA